ncbi:hypothetical protein GBAR_LOCUS14732 [Geodia barretti]|uniref:Uncharacterized protein n=1 Tax=Geodia barretti TaxID=519541 RepID=A0AA35WM64_GEOBA|nr:hypothetical protein GBAR_LOCUS14732 [Geodia barretti]
MCTSITQEVQSGRGITNLNYQLTTRNTQWTQVGSYHWWESSLTNGGYMDDTTVTVRFYSYCRNNIHYGE